MKNTVLRTVAAISLAVVAFAFAMPAIAEDAAKETKPAKPKKHEYTGEITSMDAAKKTVTVKKKDGDEKTFTLGEKAKIVVKDKEAAELSDLKAGQKVMVTYTEDGAVLTAHRIMQADAMKKKEKKADEKK
jgi:hypothetical protein